jgi:hypothetical protein
MFSTGMLVGCAGALGAAEDWQRERVPILAGFYHVYQPCVVETGGAWRYHMWFFGWAAAPTNPDDPGCDAIYLARSHDLRRWEVYGRDGSWQRPPYVPAAWAPVVCASDRWYDAWHNGDPSVVFKEGRYYMAYSATSVDVGEVDGYPFRMACCVMGAVSDDGIRWTKSAAPLLIAEQDAFPPQPARGRIGDFHRPCLRHENGVWRLWFDYVCPRRSATSADAAEDDDRFQLGMGYAENRGDFLQPGGFVLQHELRQPLLDNWPNPEVIKVGNRYHGFADPSGYPVPADWPRDGKGWASRQIREAVSEDGVHWTKLDYIAPDPDTPACQVPQALVTRIEGRTWLYLFYATQVGYRERIGLTDLSQPTDKPIGSRRYQYEYDRLRAMRRPVPDGAAEADRSSVHE